MQVPQNLKTSHLFYNNYLKAPVKSFVLTIKKISIYVFKQFKSFGSIFRSSIPAEVLVNDEEIVHLVSKRFKIALPLAYNEAVENIILAFEKTNSAEERALVVFKETNNLLAELTNTSPSLLEDDFVEKVLKRIAPNIFPNQRSNFIENYISKYLNVIILEELTDERVKESFYRTDLADKVVNVMPSLFRRVLDPAEEAESSPSEITDLALIIDIRYAQFREALGLS